MQPSAAKHHLHNSPQLDRKKSSTNPHDIGKSDRLISQISTGVHDELAAGRSVVPINLHRMNEKMEQTSDPSHTNQVTPGDRKILL